MSKTVNVKKLFGNSMIYAICGIGVKCFSFFLIPIYTSYLTTADYGMTSIVGSFLTTSSFITALSLFSAVLRFYVDLKNDERQLRRFYGTIITFVFLFSIVVSIVLIIGKSLLLKYVLIDMDFYPTVMITIVSMIFYCQYSIYENILKSQQKATEYAIVMISYVILTVVLNLFFIIQLKMGGNGVLLANLLSYVIYFIYFIGRLICTKQIEFCIDKRLLKEALKYSIPIIPHNLSTQIAILISKILIGTTDTVAMVGLFSIASQFGNIADTIQGYVSTAYGPWFYEQLSAKQEGITTHIRRVSNMLTLVIGFFMLGISLFSHDYIVLFLHKSYALAWIYVPLLVSVFLIKIIYYFYVEVLFFYKSASRLLFIATLSSSFLNVIISYFSIQSFGVLGSIIADIIAMLVRVAIVVYISRKFSDVGLKLGDFIKNIGFILTMMIIGLSWTYMYYQTSFSILEFLYRCMIIVMYLMICMMKYKVSVMSIISQVRNKFK
ncbi:lipopolysaccharide biosynthesis protein [Streptococcus sp. S784/96/1]|uniref:lipopolysaccharide biosynthesis protein n=1 Tax=Streptococcus sp. S784/96/1 TaxID=2653499 RepID=UPI001389D0CB|nr:oligosaccharide flippase family protein [Streptococcus sp. S784/96/1]